MIAKILLALTFLTRLPVGKRDFGNLTLSQSVAAFPIVGVFIGLLTGYLYIIAVNLGFTNIIAAWAAIIFGILLTGGLHEDGLADTADGLASGRNQEKKLEIMRDSRIGSYGVLALIAVVSLRATAMSEFAGAFGTLLVFATTSACSRAFMAIFMRTVPFARSDGLAKAGGRPTLYQTMFALFIAIITLLFTGKIFAEFFAIILLVIIFIIMRNVVLKNFGGITGDVLGAIQQISEVGLLLVFVVFQ